MLNYIKSFKQFNSHNIYYIGKQFYTTAQLILLSLLPLFTVIGEILAVISIFFVAYIFLHLGQPFNPWTP